MISRINSRVIGRFVLKFNKIVYKGNLNMYGIPNIYKAKGSKIELGKGVTIISKDYANPVGILRPVTLRTMNASSEIKIGDNTGISGSVVCSQISINIGSNVLIGSNVVICDTDLHPTKIENRRFSNQNIKSKPIKIEDNVWIGMNSTILKGVTIGENSVVGAGSVVVTSIPENCIAGGNPAKVIKYLDA